MSVRIHDINNGYFIYSILRLLRAVDNVCICGISYTDLGTKTSVLYIYT